MNKQNEMSKHRDAADRTGHSDLHTLTGVYGCGALEADETAAFTTHLRDCVQCEPEARELIETTALLGLAAATAAPPGMRTAVFAEIARTRQPPPVVVPMPVRTRTGRWSVRRTGLTTAACLAVLGIGLGSHTWRQQNQNSGPHHGGDRIAAPAKARDLRTVTGSGDGGTATVTLSRAMDQIQFLPSNLTAPAPGRTYQIWLVGPAGPRSVGTFNPEPGRSSPRLFPGPGQATELVVTEEPAGGSTRPTTQPILSMMLPT